jgi:cytochrome oxidase Cu insertion factor (SCO1/SenC/PrrC family)
VAATPMAPAITDPGPPPPQARRRWLLAIGIGLVVGGLLGGSVAFMLVHRAHAEQLPASCQDIGCSELGSGAAPAFALSDQNGRPVALDALRGKVVVLGFMDPVCTNICPIVASEFINVDRMLGRDAAQVEFVCVNVNQFQESRASVRKYSHERGLSALSNWHFLTGSTDQLKQVWNAYHVAVIPNSTGDVVHTSVLYFIDPSGRLRIDAMPVQAKRAVATWAHSITDLVRYLQSN